MNILGITILIGSAIILFAVALYNEFTEGADKDKIFTVMMIAYFMGIIGMYLLVNVSNQHKIKPEIVTTIKYEMINDSIIKSDTIYTINIRDK